MDDSSWHGTVASNPDLYDLLHGEPQDEVAMYSSLSEGCDAILECGIGSGRIAIPLARAGIEVHGIDTSAEMLAQLELKLKAEPGTVGRRVHPSMADMRSFDLGRSFSFAYVPFMTFNYLLTIEAQRECLAALYRHLKPGGTLLIELISLYREWFYNDGIARFVLRRKHPESGQIVDIFRVTRFDPATQILEHDRQYRFLDDLGRLDHERTVFLRNRFFFLGEAQLLLAEAGFTLTAIWGDHKRGPYDRDSQVMILVASR
jgi:SAM-dependent methyltransferase